jgi:hypothetical protein
LPGIVDSIVLQVDAGKIFDRCLKDKRLIKIENTRGFYRLERSYTDIIALSTPETQYAPDVRAPPTPIKNSGFETNTP